MADNYLEKKYEELQSRKAAGTKAGLGKKKTTSFHKTRRVFVTEGTKGIGPAIVRAFRLAGNRVVFCGINEEVGKLTAEKTGTTFLHANAADKVALKNCLQSVLQKWDDLDIIIHNATFCQSDAITETSVEDFEQMVSANLHPAFIASHLLTLHRRSKSEANPYGRIINVLAAGPSPGKAGYESYSVAKAGIESLTHALATSLADWHITINSITAGQTTTCEEDVVRMCLYLCQEENKSLNGENITINGSISK